MMPIEMEDKDINISELTYVYDAGTGNNNFQTKVDKQAKTSNYKKKA